jgi:hypothetical protein
MSTILEVFTHEFARDLGKISALFQTIPRIDTGNDGCDITLVSADGKWMCSAFPIFDDGHDGELKLSICAKEGAGWGRWTQLNVRFSKQGEVVSATFA